MGIRGLVDERNSGWKITFTLSSLLLNRLHLRSDPRIGSAESSIILWVIIGGNEDLWAAYIHLLSLTISPGSMISSPDGISPLIEGKVCYNSVSTQKRTALTSSIARTFFCRYLSARLRRYPSTVWRWPDL